MYTLLRKIPRSSGYLFNIADWSDSTVDTLTQEELEKCIKLGFKIEGTEIAPCKRGTDKVFTLEGTDKLGAQVSVVVSYHELEGTICISFHVEGKSYYSDDSIGSLVIIQPVTSVFSAPERDKKTGNLINKRVRTDSISVSYMKLLDTGTECPLFKLGLLGTDSSTGDCFCKDYILEYHPDTNEFHYVGASRWRVQDETEQVVVDRENKSLVLSASRKRVCLYG